MISDFQIFKDATNVYRTNKYIIKQCIVVGYHDKLDNCVVSHDTYYIRNHLRDKLYETYYKSKQNINGKRLPSTSQLKRYVL